MATIPIEIILQDAETPVEPTPTPESETNIMVPDTGAGAVENSSAFSSSSVASIILPAVLLVAALATICTILIRRHHKHQDNNNKTTKKEKLITATSTTIAVLSATVLVGNLVIPAANAATSVAPGTAELETEDKITIIATREQDSDTITATVKDTSYATANLDFGYKVTASMAEGLDSANLYLDGDETSEYYITPVVDGTLADNTWGYTLEEPSEDTAYLSIPLEDTPATIVKGNNEIEDEPVDIYYTIKVDKSLPAGTYTGELEYSIAPTVEYMQDFATMTEAEKTATLANMPEGKQYTLKDIRDEKPYYISKLADGNVWMTQNLDLDLNENTTLTPVDTNVSANWTPTSSTIYFTGKSVPGWQNSETNPYSADPGDIYYYTSGTDTDDIQYNSLAECEAGHGDGTCQHYHVGNYYNWPAAVASNDTSSMTEEFENAPDSICPAGWRLPKNANSAGDMSKNEQITMISSYNNILGNYIASGTPPYYEYLANGFDLIRTNPLWISRAGMISWGSASSLKSSAGYWSSTRGNSRSLSYYLDIKDNIIIPMSSNGTRYGYSIRCLAE